MVSVEKVEFLVSHVQSRSKRASFIKNSTIRHSLMFTLFINYISPNSCINFNVNVKHNISYDDLFVI